jgi:hypothetical protein
MCMFHHVGGERPTRAGPDARAEVADSSAAGDGPWGGTRLAPRGGSTKWSVSGELLRSRVVAWRIGAPFPRSRVAWGGSFSAASPVGCTRIGPSDAERAYRGREARRQPTMTAGTLTFVRTAWCGEVRTRYKLCEIRVLCGGVQEAYPASLETSASPGEGPAHGQASNEALGWRQAGDRGEEP